MMYLTEVLCLMAVILLGHDHFRYYMPLCQNMVGNGKGYNAASSDV